VDKREYMKLIEYNYNFNKITNNFEKCGFYFAKMVDIGIIF